MPVIKCKGCGRTTNTVVADWLDLPENSKGIKFSKVCYAAFENGAYIKGCAYDKIPMFSTKIYVDRMIGKCSIPKCNEKMVVEQEVVLKELGLMFKMPVCKKHSKDLIKRKFSNIERKG